VLSLHSFNICHACFLKLEKKGLGSRLRRIHIELLISKGIGIDRLVQRYLGDIGIEIEDVPPSTICHNSLRMINDVSHKERERT